MLVHSPARCQCRHQALAFVGAASFSYLAGELCFAEGDLDGIGGTDFQIQMSGVALLIATDFWL